MAWLAGLIKAVSPWVRSPDDRHEETVKRPKQPQYVGSYVILVDFLSQCRRQGCKALSEEDFQKLLAAVEDLSRQGSGQRVKSDQALFSGQEDSFMEVLPAMGISIDTRKSSEAGHIKRISEFEKFEEVHHLESDKPSVVPDEIAEGILGNFHFDNRTRGDIKLDARILLYGFKSPYNLIERYKINSGVLLMWIEAIANQYLMVPYHNWRHAFDVFQFSFMAMTKGAAERFFNFQDILAHLLAVIAHDVGHTGTNNAFLVKTGHETAICYNDVSPLENMHSSLFFQTLHKPELNFLSGQSAHDYSNIRQKVIDSILATDMAHHFEFVDRFSARVCATEADPFQVDTKNDRGRQKASKGDRRMLLQAFTHMADLGHCCRPWDVHKHIIVALEKEFFYQGDMERARGMPIMPLMDRNVDSAAAAQGFFLDKMVRPLLVPYTHFLLPELGETLINSLDANKDMWAALLQKHGKMTAAELLPLEAAGTEDKESEQRVLEKHC